MAGSSKQKKEMAVKMAMYFAENGYIPDPKEFAVDVKRPSMYKLSIIRKIFGSWSIMVQYTKSFCPEVMRGITGKKPKPEVDPLEALKAKPAEIAESEVVDGKDI